MAARADNTKTIFKICTVLCEGQAVKKELLPSLPTLAVMVSLTKDRKGLKLKVNGYPVRQPFVHAPFLLRPQPPSIGGWWASRGERKVGDLELDDAYVIEAPEAASELLRGVRARLLTLRDHGAQISAADRLVVDVEVDLGLRRSLDAVALLWRDVVRFSLGDALDG